MSAIVAVDRPRLSEKLTLSRPSVRSIPFVLRFSELDKQLPSDPPRCCLLDDVRRFGAASSDSGGGGRRNFGHHLWRELH